VPVASLRSVALGGRSPCGGRHPWGCSIRFARKSASPLVAARGPSPRPSCLLRRRGVGFRDPDGASVATFYRNTRPIRTSLPFDAPNTGRACAVTSACRPPVRFAFSPPPFVCWLSTPRTSRCAFGPRHGGRDSCSAPAVSHRFDGLLQPSRFGPVASRYRTWGSLGFRCACRCRLATRRTWAAFPPARLPFEGLLLVGSRTRSLGPAPFSLVPERASLRSGPNPVSTARSPGSCCGPPAWCWHAGTGISSRSLATAPLRLAGICEPTRAVRQARVSMDPIYGRRVSPGQRPSVPNTRRIDSECCRLSARPPRTERARGGTSSRYRPTVRNGRSMPSCRPPEGGRRRRRAIEMARVQA
jgi:hypothetical protein